MTEYEEKNGSSGKGRPAVSLRPGEVIRIAGKIKIIESGKGLAWGTDAWLLAAYIRKCRRLCELGCGSGVISLAAAAYGRAESVTGIEVMEEPADRADRAAALNGFGDRVRVVRRDIREVRYTDPGIGGRFDAVAANPPYISHPGKAKGDPESDAARHELHGGVADFCAAAARLLDHRGSFFVVFRPARLPDLFSSMRAVKLEPKKMTFVCPDAASAPSLVLCEAVLGAAPGLDVSPPLFFYRDRPSVTPRIMTERMSEIYESCSFGERR
ncbi:MAG: methyltransferase [Clostridia bacterium]|nr:methyltransferase [Clostridia bacterium]